MDKKTRQTRRFSTEFKKEKVALLDAGKITVRELSKIYEVSQTAVYNWVNKYSKLPMTERIVVEKISEEQKNKELLERIKELERAVGRKQLEIDYYKTTLDVLQEQEGENLKKKHKPKL
jgi:transposase